MDQEKQNNFQHKSNKKKFIRNSHKEFIRSCSSSFAINDT